MLTGHAPYETEKHNTFVAKMKAHVIEPIPDLKAARPDVPDELNALYQQMLTKEPAERIASAAEVAKTLARIIRALRGGVSTVQDRPAEVPTRPAPVTSAPAANDELQSALAAISLVSAPHRVADPAPQAVRKRPGCLPVALAGSLAAAILLAGIIITIRNRDGSTTRIEVPDDSSIEVTRDGKPLASIPPQATKPSEPTGETNDPPATTPPGNGKSDTTLPATPPSVAATANVTPVIVPKFAGDVESIAISTDDRWLVCGNREEGLVRVYDRRTLQTKAFLSAGTHSAGMVAFSKENRLAVRCLSGRRNDYELTIWDLETPNQLPMSRHAHIAAFAWSPHSEVLATSKQSGELGLWDAQKNEWKSWQTKIQEVIQLAFSADGQFLAVQTRGNAIHLLRAGTGESLQEIQLPTEGRSGVVGSFAWSPSEPWLAIAQPTNRAERSLIRVLEFPSGKEVRSFEIEALNPAGASLLQWKQPDRFLVAGGNKVLVVSSDTGRPLTVFPLDVYEPIRTIAGSVAGDIYVAAPSSGVMHLRSDAGGNSQRNLWELPVMRVGGWQPGGDQLLKTISPSFWMPGKIVGTHLSGLPTQHWRTDNDANAGTFVRWLAHGQLVSENGSEFRLYDSSGEFRTSVNFPDDLRRPQYLSIPSPAVAQHFVAPQFDGKTLFVFDRDLQLKSKIPFPSKPELGWTPDGQMLAAAVPGEGITFFALDGAAGKTITDPPHTAARIAISPQGTLTAGCTDLSILAWDNSQQFQWKYMSTEVPPGNAITSLYWSPVDEVLAVGYRTGHIELLDGEGKLIRRLPGPSAMTPQILWTSDGKFVSVNHEWTFVRTWSVDGQLQWTGFVLPDGSQANFAADGTLLHGDPKLIDEHLVFLVTDDLGKQHPLTYSAFQKWR